jgi:hypothetical protein
MSGEVMLGREPTDVANLTQEPGGQHRPDPEQLDQVVLAWATAVLMRASTSAMRCSSWRTSAIRSAASLWRVSAGAPAGVTAASSAAARLAIRLRRTRFRRLPGVVIW